MARAKKTSGGEKPKPAARGKKGEPKARAGSATVRFYCQGIGDCHLLRFPREAGGEFRMLIDCGVHSSVKGGNTFVDGIVDDLIAATAPDHRIDVVVMTHEHWDHVSGFFTAAAKFRQLKIGEVWMAWTEDPDDPQARRLDKYKGMALAAIEDAGRRMNTVLPAISDSGEKAYLASLAAGIESLAGFNFGAKGEKVRSARDAITALAPDKVRYFDPAHVPIALPGVPGLRIYVLGPPRDEKLLGIRERASEMYGIDSGGWPIARALSSALAADAGDAMAGSFVAPFEPDLGFEFAPAMTQAGQPAGQAGSPADVEFLRNHYAAPQDDWRRIDHDWLSIGADLAMQLDDRTNNTSLVLAFEFAESGRVMLFAADAQVGNWLSWQDVKWRVGERDVTGPDLLRRTVFYKVGHHGSHNATLKGKGLEMMADRDLSAFIPTNKADAKKVKWGEMPFDLLVADLMRRASQRVIRADDDWISEDVMKLPFRLPSGSLVDARHRKGLWVEFDIA